MHRGVHTSRPRATRQADFRLLLEGLERRVVVHRQNALADPLRKSSMVLRGDTAN